MLESLGAKIVMKKTDWIGSVGGVLVAALALACSGCRPSNSPRAGTMSDPLYDSWEEAEVAINALGNACLWHDASGGSGSANRNGEPQKPNDPAACTKAWTASGKLPKDGGLACYELVGARIRVMDNLYMPGQETPNDVLARFAGSGQVVAVDLNGKSTNFGLPSHEAMVLVVRPKALEKDYVAPLDKRIATLTGKFDEYCPATYEQPAKASDCLRELASLKAAPDAYLDQLSTANLGSPFGSSEGISLRSPGCYKMAVDVEAQATARVESAVAVTLHRSIDAEHAAKLAAKLDVCGEPTRSTDCQLAVSYLELLGRFNPSSSEIGDVTALLETAKPKLEALSDHEAWASTDMAGCAEPANEKACAAGEQYLSRRPSGLHAAEVQSAIAKATPKIRALAAKREAAERAEAVRQAEAERVETVRQAEAERVEALQQAAAARVEAVRLAAEEAAERRRPKRVEPRTSARTCKPKERWRSNNNQIETDMIQTEWQNIVLWCQDYSGKGCVEQAMNRRARLGQFAISEVHGMAAACCCQMMD